MAFQAVFHQVVVMFLLMGVGYGIYKGGMINDNTVGEMTSILMMVVSPVVIIYSFHIKATPSLLHGLLIAFLSAMAAHAVSILVGMAVFNRKTADDSHRKFLRYVTVYSNCGFIGIPLLSAVVGTKGIFYASAYIAAFNLFNWTHGVSVFTGRPDRKSLLKLLTNPNLIAVLLGFLLFIFAVPIPAMATDGMKYIFDLNTPLAMLILGARTAKLNLRTLVTDLWIWPGVLMRNLLLPFAAIFALHFAGVSGVLLLACLVPIACPIGGNTVLFAELFKTDTRFASKLVTVSTLLSALTLPFLVYIVSFLHY